MRMIDQKIKSPDNRLKYQKSPFSINLKPLYDSVEQNAKRNVLDLELSDSPS